MGIRKHSSDDDNEWEGGPKLFWFGGDAWGGDGSFGYVSGFRPVRQIAFDAPTPRDAFPSGTSSPSGVVVLFCAIVGFRLRVRSSTAVDPIRCRPKTDVQKNVE